MNKPAFTSQPSSTTDVELVPYHCEHDAILHTFYLPEDQQQFTGMPDKMLVLAKQDPHRHPVVITATGRPVGFFILYDGDELTDYTNTSAALLLRAFSIHYADQGQGYAKNGLLQLPQYISRHFPNILEVVLGVNARNLPAYNLYLKCGFKDEDDTRMGSHGLQHILKMSLSS
ncbi:N-acetyltransferase [Paenibacillus sp. 28ISP30-2]|uniref:GNAT family N-acetyltransferase n=1 Tax=Paenibacillus sp. IHB B 3084 TaxID=867076 RepID=UPI000721300A|nr:GNAT family protein [Paenibacillus sp. IHB B 3084]ALP35808.1 acetyltransferase [Paenibacillus sp. IHB B 3084]MBE0341581.1 N-acetyltransferase [Paenibacillus sp. 28ISP30-2]